MGRDRSPRRQKHPPMDGPLLFTRNRSLRPITGDAADTNINNLSTHSKPPSVPFALASHVGNSREGQRCLLEDTGGRRLRDYSELKREILEEHYPPPTHGAKAFASHKGLRIAPHLDSSIDSRRDNWLPRVDKQQWCEDPSPYLCDEAKDHGTAHKKTEYRRRYSSQVSELTPKPSANQLIVLVRRNIRRTHRQIKSVTDGKYNDVPASFATVVNQTELKAKLTPKDEDVTDMLRNPCPFGSSSRRKGIGDDRPSTSFAFVNGQELKPRYKTIDKNLRGGSIPRAKRVM